MIKASFVRMVCDKTRPDLCPGCGARIDVFDNSTTTGHEIVAMCHGQVEKYRIDAANLMSPRPERVFDGIAKWMRDLFKFDGLPDIRELLHYNRGRVPKNNGFADDFQ